jgi:anthranilate phosphoribosyltransferase
MTAFLSTISKSELRLIYSDASEAEKARVLDKLGTLKPVFAQFLENENRLSPLDTVELINIFDACSDPTKNEQEILEFLLRLEPGNGKIGFRQVNILVDHLRRKVTNFLKEDEHQLNLIPHDHAFGSGGDLIKTMHATTAACIIAAPLVKICKTGTKNVTSLHGSNQAIKEFGYDQFQINADFLNNLLRKYGFAYIPLDYLGFPYSDSLRNARRKLWNKSVEQINYSYQQGTRAWQEVVKNLDLKTSIDIFKIVSPNAQVLNPVHHSTGVCHLKMLPYVLGIYLHLNSKGVIAHCYDGIDEISNTYVDTSINLPNNLVIKIDSETTQFAEFSPEDIGLERADYTTIQEQELKKERDTFIRVLRGKKENLQGARDFLVANTSLLLVANDGVVESEMNLINQLRKGVEKAEYLIDSGETYENFRRLIEQIDLLRFRNATVNLL